MYVESDFLKPDEKYYKIFRSIVEFDTHNILDTLETPLVDIPTAWIIPLPTESYNKPINTFIDRKIILHNALIKSISLQGGFTSNSIALSKFSVSMTYAYFDCDA